MSWTTAQASNLPPLPPGNPSIAGSLAAGHYLLGATYDWRHPPAHWWRSAPDPRHADPVSVSRDTVAPTVDILLETPASGAQRTP